jgi:SAM-dependent methyltransferase
VLDQVDYGVDPYRQALAQASQRKLYRQLIDQPIENANLQPGSIGTVTSNSVFEHLPDPALILQAAARLLQPGGKLIFTTPSDAFGSWLALPARRYIDWRNRHFDHRNLWSVERWRDCLNQAGLEVVEVRPYISRTWVRYWDLVDLSEQVWIGRRRLVGQVWKHLSPRAMDRIAQRAARLDLASALPGGGRLIAAIKQ